VARHLDLFPLGHGPRLPAADRQGDGGVAAASSNALRFVTGRAAQRGRGETGRRKGLKIPRPFGCAGSTPAVRTMVSPGRRLWNPAAVISVIEGASPQGQPRRHPAPGPLMPNRIEDYAVIGNCETAALVG